MTDRMSAAEFIAFQASAEAKAPGVKRVQGAERTDADGHTFDSKREARRYFELSTAQWAGLISHLELQVPVELMGRDGPILTRTGRVMRYVADFRYFDTAAQEWVFEDAKGFQTEVYKIKRAILAAQGIHIKEV